MNANAPKARHDRLELVDLAQAPDEIRNAMLTLRNRPEIRNFMISGSEISQSQHSAWLASLNGNLQSLVYAAMAGDELAGQVNFARIDRENRHAEWGFFLDPAFRGKGMAAKMLAMALDLAFGEIGLQKINAGVLDHNGASLALHQRLGFAPEGRRRRHALHNGTWRDLVLWGMTREEWLAAKPAGKQDKP